MFRRRLTAVLTAAALDALSGPAPGAPGDLDLTFGGTGFVQLTGSINGAAGMAVQTDGKILLAGTRDFSSHTRMSLWRYHPDGTPDNSFGVGGRADGPEDGAAGSFGETVFVRSDGRILLIGRGHSFATNGYVACFTPDGRLDPSFGPAQNGLVTFPDFASENPAAALQPDGKIVIAGAGDFSPQPKVWRLLPGGSPDPSFGTGGSITMPNGTLGISSCTAVCVQVDGKILLGRADDYCTVTRLLPNGARDTAFGGGTGNANLNPPAGASVCRAVTVLPDGNILAAGNYSVTATVPPVFGFIFVEWSPSGILDASFGGAATPGRTLMPLDSSSAQLAGVVVQTGDRILGAGTAGTDFAVVRLTCDGLPDNTFGASGGVRTGTGGGIASSVALVPGEEKLLVAGSRTTPATGMLSLMVRYQVQGPMHLTVEQPPGTRLSHFAPAPVDFGPVTAGIAFREFTLRNSGTSTLTGLTASVTNEFIPGDYHAFLNGPATLAPGAEVSLLVSLAPSAAPGVRTATLRLAGSNTNPALPPRLISLTGSKATALQIWRYTWFGNTENSGSGADANDFDHDGLPNFLEYATVSHPHVYTQDPCRPAGEAAFTYTRPAAALTEISYTPEFAPKPDGPWSAAGLVSTVLTDDGTLQTVQVAPSGAVPRRLFLRLRVTKL